MSYRSRVPWLPKSQRLVKGDLGVRLAVQQSNCSVAFCRLPDSNLRDLGRRHMSARLSVMLHFT